LFGNCVPPELIPIGSDPGGNVIFLGVKGKENGKVYFGNHEFEDDDGYFLRSWLADTFTEFLEKCYIYEDEDDEEEE
jgi:hypothetical protein